MQKHILVLIVTLRSCVVSENDCSFGHSCSECLQLSNSCVWCDTQGSRQCSAFISTTISRLICPQKWYQQSCPLNEPVDKDKLKLDKVFSLLSSLKSYRTRETGEYPQEQTDARPVVEKVNMDPDAQNLDNMAGTANTGALKYLLNKLMLLKLLKKLKETGGKLSTNDRAMLREITESVRSTTTTTTIAPNSTNETQDLNNILDLLKQENNANNMLKELGNLLTTSTAAAPITQTTTTNKTTRSPVINHIESVEVNYEEAENEDLSQLTGGKRSTELPKLANLTTQKSVHSYCPLFEGVDMCNSDHNCTWCNTLDHCMARTTNNYNYCVVNKERMVDKDFGLDKCLSLSECQQCVTNDKCYWCERSKSCHTYPFFGFVPPACGEEWYVKQCDVELAVIIIVLPLMIILLAMITFYFCLKYCYYKRKVLRVPLFEKPGVFDYRKDKKVYFVNPEDEESGDEFVAGRFGKKYRLPMEKAPLIDPNS